MVRRATKTPNAQWVRVWQGLQSCWVSRRLRSRISASNMPHKLSKRETTFVRGSFQSDGGILPYHEPKSPVDVYAWKLRSR